MLTSLTLALLTAAAAAILLAARRDRAPNLAAILAHSVEADKSEPPSAPAEPEKSGPPCAPVEPEPAGRGPAPDPFAAMRRRPPRMFFAVVEIDRFAATRSTVGFAIANRVLVAVGERLRAGLKDVRAGRTGQSSLEFSFFAPSDEEARAQLEACLRRVEEPIELDGIVFRLRARVAFGGADGEKGSLSDALVHSVLGALGDEGGERVRLVAPVPGIRPEIDDLAILRALPRAMEAGELTLHYQPKFDCRRGEIASAEALMRWNSPTFGPVPTQRIVILAEQTGAIHGLTLWAVEQAKRDQAALAAAGHDLIVSVNLSGVLIPDRPFMLDLLERLRTASGRLGVEITETAVIDDPEAAIENLSAFASAGVRVAIDDFGSGLSSLNYLKRLPAHELKIDRQFVMGLTDSHRDPLIVRASIDLAHALEMLVTAEGVEDPMSMSLLRVMGCDMLQGYFIAKPMPLDRLVEFLGSEQRHLDAGEAVQPNRRSRRSEEPEGTL